MTIFALFLFVLILMIAGTAVDLARHEHERVAIQQTADAAVLATSSIDIEQSVAEARAREYFEKAGLAGVLGPNSIVVDGSGISDNERTVTITANARMDTMFMNLMGIENLPLQTLSRGAQSATDIEISLVLDISSSMNSSNRLPRLKQAVEDFAISVIPEDPLASASEISINMVPYSLSVNPGAEIAAHYNIDNKHSLGDCIWFETADYNELSITLADPNPAAPQTVYERYTHMADGSSGYNNGIVDLPMCPDHEISPLMTTRTQVNDAVNALVGWDGTGIDIGAKWGFAMLDPEFGDVVDTLVSTGTVESRMTGRPFDYGDSTKYMILMSDGENDSQRDLHARLREGPSLIWRDNATGTFSVLAEDGREADGFDGGNDSNSVWWHESGNDIEPFPDTSGAGGTSTDWSQVEGQMTNLTWPEVFNIARTTDIYNRFFERIDQAGFLTNQEANEYKQPLDFDRITEADTNQRLADLCAEARAEGKVTIYAISFDAPSSLAEDTLKDCVGAANLETNFFSVGGAGITSAFQSIAREITRVRLTQ